MQYLKGWVVILFCVCFLPSPEAYSAPRNKAVEEPRLISESTFRIMEKIQSNVYCNGLCISRSNLSALPVTESLSIYRTSEHNRMNRITVSRLYTGKYCLTKVGNHNPEYSSLKQMNRYIDETLFPDAATRASAKTEIIKRLKTLACQKKK